MKSSTYSTVAGFTSLLIWAMATPSLAEPLAYSPDRWPARWSTIVQQNQAIEDDHAYGYGNYQAQPVRHENPWTHDSSVLFHIPAVVDQRPWGAPPRKSRRQMRADRYREQRRPVYRSNRLYNPYRYAGMTGMMPQAYPGLGYMNSFGGLGGFGMVNPYGISPLLSSPLMMSPLPGSYPYAGGYPVGMGGMNWPLGAW